MAMNDSLLGKGDIVATNPGSCRPSKPGEYFTEPISDFGGRVDTCPKAR